MSQSISKWWETIKTHYGALEKFEDATTVRIMRNQCRAWVADDVITVILLEEGPADLLAEYDARIQAERDEVDTVLGACCSWLKARGLE
ncbi:MAG: hypothetical protein KK482_09860 [Sinorhizobium meliloti]|nr:hypothetical protein [Sinorhizobium meliloti]